MQSTAPAPVEDWLAGRPSTTASAYRRDAEQYLSASSSSLPEASRGDVQAWLDGLAEAGASASTLKRKRAALSSLFRFLDAEGLREGNPAARCRVPPVRSRTSEKILSVEQVQLLFHVGAEAGRDRLMLRVLYALALRASDLISIERRDVRPADAAESKAAGLVDLFGKGGKEATLRMDGGPWPLLWARAKKAEGPGVLIFDVSRSTVWRVTKRAAERARLPEGVSPHWLRHSAISHMLDAGAAPHAVRQFARHASLETTSTYAHARPSASPGSVLAA